MDYSHFQYSLARNYNIKLMNMNEFCAMQVKAYYNNVWLN